MKKLYINDIIIDIYRSCYGKKYLSDGLLNNATVINTKSSESTCYHTDIDFIKLFTSSCTTPQRILTVEEISKYQNSSCVCPKYEVLDSHKNNLFYGYGTEYLKDYSMLSSLIESDQLTHKDRIEISKTICLIIDSILRDNIAYYDIHSDNILVKGKDIKLIDMDSVIIESLSDKQIYQRAYYTSFANMNSIVLSILFGIDIPYFPELTIKNPKVFKSKANKSELALIDYSINHSYEVFSPLEYIDDVREEYVSGVRKLIRNK